MPKVSDYYASESNLLKAEDLKGESVIVKIKGVQEVEFDGKKKLCLSFDGTDKELALNKTNASTIAALYGDDTDAWHGQEIELFTATVSYQGSMVPAIRVKSVAKAGAKI